MARVSHRILFVFVCYLSCSCLRAHSVLRPPLSALRSPLSIAHASFPPRWIRMARPWTRPQEMKKLKCTPR